MQRGNIFEISARGFYRLRAARILPTLALAIAIGVVGLVAVAPDDPMKVFKREGEIGLAFWLSLPLFVFNWLRMQVDSAGKPMAWGMHRDVLWSLAVEEQFYIAFPWILLWTSRIGRLLPALIVIVAMSTAWRLAAPGFQATPSAGA